MEPMILKQDIVETIKTDPILWGKVAAALGVSILTLRPALMKENNKRFTQAAVLKVLREHLNVSDSELLTEMEPV